MSRPKPEVLLSRTDRQGIKGHEVLRAEGVYAIFYLGKPISLRVRQLLVDYPGPKYPRAFFSHPGSAWRTCRKLRRDFRDDGFGVFLLTDSGPVEIPNPDPSKPPPIVIDRQPKIKTIRLL